MQNRYDVIDGRLHILGSVGSHGLERWDRVSAHDMIQPAETAAIDILGQLRAAQRTELAIRIAEEPAAKVRVLERRVRDLEETIERISRALSAAFGDWE